MAVAETDRLRENRFDLDMLTAERGGLIDDVVRVKWRKVMFLLHRRVK